MKPIESFTVKADDHLYNEGLAELYFDGKPIGLKVDGVALRAQFETSKGFLLITDNNDPWECIAKATLVDHEFNQIGSRTLGKEGLLFARRTFCPCFFEVQGETLVIKGVAADEGSYVVSLQPTSFFRRNPVEATFIEPSSSELDTSQ